MPNKLGTEEERECEDPIPDKHKKKRPLTRGEAEIFDTRVATGPRVPSLIEFLLDRIFLRFKCWRGALITGDTDLRNRSLAQAQPPNLCGVPVS
jgi:hypothetical protein